MSTPTPAANPHARCPETDPERLGMLYDNNGDARNRADLQALQAASAAAFDDRRVRHRRLQLGLEVWQWADCLQPAHAGTQPLPALLFVHGGRWQRNTSRETAFWAPACADAGLAFVGLNFAPLSEGGLPAQVDQVATAIGLLCAQAHEHGLDPGALVLAGHSSGAHLALAALLRASQNGAAGPAGRLRALLLLGGLYDLEPLRLSTHQPSLGFSAEVVACCSPLQQLHAATAAGLSLRLPPTLVAVGGEESSEFRRQSRALHWALQAHQPTRWFEVSGAAHFDAALEFDRPASTLRSFLVDALRQPAA